MTDYEFDNSVGVKNCVFWNLWILQKRTWICKIPFFFFFPEKTNLLWKRNCFIVIVFSGSFCVGRGTIVHCDAEQDVLILYFSLSHKKFIPDAPYWHCVSSQELLKLKSGSQTITHRWKREISIDCFPFTRKEKWGEVLVQGKMGKMSWGLHLVLLVMERHPLFFSSLWSIFPMKHHCGGMENRVKKKHK